MMMDRMIDRMISRAVDGVIVIDMKAVNAGDFVEMSYMDTAHEMFRRGLVLCDGGTYRLTSLGRFRRMAV